MVPLPGAQPRHEPTYQWGNEQPGHVKRREVGPVLFDCTRRARRSVIVVWPCGLKDLGQIGTSQGEERGSDDGAPPAGAARARGRCAGGDACGQASLTPSRVTVTLRLGLSR